MGNIPFGQKNANLHAEQIMRAGIPSISGKLNFHAFDKEYKCMVSANAFWNTTKNEFHIPYASDLFETDFALDSAGYTAMKMWQDKGPQSGMAGIFPWTFQQYIELVSIVKPSWWSQPDLCCEPEIAKNQSEIDFRVNATATLLEGTLRVLYDWQNKLSASWDTMSIANCLYPPVPIIQGWSADDYLRSLDLLQEVWRRWEPWLDAPLLIGLGSVCRRDLTHPEHGLFAILAALEGKIPKGAKLHLFGVKGSALSKIKMMDWVASVDSMAYDYTSRVNAYRDGVSNTIAHRSMHMDKWMHAATSRMSPSAGDQFRLTF